MRWSKYFLQTVREVPGDAEAVSHILLTRAGMMRRIAGGMYALTPLGLRAHRKTETIVREEMDRSGALELEVPILQPRELWDQSGRLERYADGRNPLPPEGPQGREYCLAPTAEEAVTTMVKSGITSYRQLPVTLYQIRTKFRDEIRPRFGLMRGREFLMYDGYSFDADAEGLDRSYRAQDAAYRAIFTRCGLEFTVVQADSGAIGGSAIRKSSWSWPTPARTRSSGAPRADTARTSKEPRPGGERARGKTRRWSTSRTSRRRAWAASKRSSTSWGSPRRE